MIYHLNSASSEPESLHRLELSRIQVLKVKCHPLSKLEALLKRTQCLQTLALSGMAS